MPLGLGVAVTIGAAVGLVPVSLPKVGLAVGGIGLKGGLVDGSGVGKAVVGADVTIGASVGDAVSLREGAFVALGRPASVGSFVRAEEDIVGLDVKLVDGPAVEVALSVGTCVAPVVALADGVAVGAEAVGAKVFVRVKDGMALGPEVVATEGRIEGVKLG